MLASMPHKYGNYVSMPVVYSGTLNLFLNMSIKIQILFQAIVRGEESDVNVVKN